MWCGISAVVVFRTDDGGPTWQPKNRGVPLAIEDKVHKDFGYCVHALGQDPAAPATIYRQDHKGMFPAAATAATRGSGSRSTIIQAVSGGSRTRVRRRAARAPAPRLRPRRSPSAPPRVRNQA
jgi:hypothetical protein